MYYQKDVDFNFAYLKLQEKVNEMQSSMPDGITVSVNRIDLTQMNNQFMELQARGSGGVDRVRNVVDEEVTGELENLDGIAGVNVYGGQEKSIEIIPDKGACEAYNITPATIRSALSQNAQSRTYVGNLYEQNQLYFVHVTAQYSYNFV